MSIVGLVKDALGLSGYSGAQYVPPGKARYTSPKGRQFEFDFEDLASSYDSKAAVFENAGGNGTYVQPNGHTSGRFPMACIFTSPRSDESARAFMGSLLEGGVGVLSHPQYRTPIRVVPVGTIERADAYVTAAGNVVVIVTFYETTGLRIGASAGLPQSFDDLMSASAEGFAAGLDLGDESVTFATKVKAAVRTVKSTMAKASRVARVVTLGSDAIGDSITRGMDVLIGQPLTMAFQLQQLVGEPARVSDLARAKLEGYAALAAYIFGRPTAALSTYNRDSINEHHLNQLLAKAAVGNSAKLAASALEQYRSRSELVLEAARLGDMQDAFQTWSDTNFAALAGSGVDASTADIGSGSADQASLVASAMGALIHASFGAKTQMVKELENERTPLDLCYELLGTTSFDVLDVFYQTNDFGGDEHFLIPKGRRIVWYV